MLLLMKKTIAFLLEYIENIYLIPFWLQFLELLLPFLILFYAVFCYDRARIQAGTSKAKRL